MEPDHDLLRNRAYIHAIVTVQTELMRKHVQLVISLIQTLRRMSEPPRELRRLISSDQAAIADPVIWS